MHEVLWENTKTFYEDVMPRNLFICTAVPHFWPSHVHAKPNYPHLGIPMESHCPLRYFR